MIFPPSVVAQFTNNECKISYEPILFHQDNTASASQKKTNSQTLPTQSGIQSSQVFESEMIADRK
jgi:hypothetical protein